MLSSALNTSFHIKYNLTADFNSYSDENEGSDEDEDQHLLRPDSSMSSEVKMF